MLQVDFKCRKHRRISVPRTKVEQIRKKIKWTLARFRFKKLKKSQICSKRHLIHFRDAKKSERVPCGLEKRVSVTEINQKHQNSMGKTLFRLKKLFPEKVAQCRKLRRNPLGSDNFSEVKSVENRRGALW